MVHRHQVWMFNNYSDDGDDGDEGDDLDTDGTLASSLDVQYSDDGDEGDKDPNPTILPNMLTSYDDFEDFFNLSAHNIMAFLDQQR